MLRDKADNEARPVKPSEQENLKVNYDVQIFFQHHMAKPLTARRFLNHQHFGAVHRFGSGIVD